MSTEELLKIAKNHSKTSLTEDINVNGVGNAVVIRFDNEVSKASIYTHSNSTYPGMVTVTEAGFFMINATINYDNTGNNRISPRASLFKNGTEISETRASRASFGFDDLVTPLANRTPLTPRSMAFETSSPDLIPAPHRTMTSSLASLTANAVSDTISGSADVTETSPPISSGGSTAT